LSVPASVLAGLVRVVAPFVLLMFLGIIGFDTPLHGSDEHRNKL